MEIVYRDAHIVVCVKPSGVKSTDEPGGMPELVKTELGIDTRVRTVHRLDQVVSGLMVLALTEEAASELSRQIREDQFDKAYLAVVHGAPEQREGELKDLLYRDKARRMTLVADAPAKGVQEARLSYRILGKAQDMSLVYVQLHTGRTHQNRVQFSNRGMPLVGERKYSTLPDDCAIALWSHKIGFRHPQTGERMEFKLDPPAIYPWNAVSL